jgi:hypothetical protein
MNLAMNDVSQNLLACMEQVMADWAFIGLDYLGQPAALPAKLPLERMISLQGDYCEVRMVVRGSFGLGLELARSVRGLPNTSLEAGPAAFAEFSGLLADEWRRRQRVEKGVDWRAAGSVASTPEFWPPATPDGAVVATARGFALEVLIWAPLGPLHGRMN